MSNYRLNRSVVTTACRTGRLDLHGLALNDLPADLFSYPALIESLTSLDLSMNRLTTLSPDIAIFKRLRSLKLDGNQLTDLPFELTTLPSLKTISLEGNSLSSDLADAYQRAKLSGDNGRDAASILARLIHREETDIEAEEQALNGANSLHHTISQIDLGSEVSTPRSPEDSLSAEMARVDGLYKKASMQSHIFDQAPTATSSSVSSRKHSTMSHTPSTVFTAANDVIETHSSKRIAAQPSKRYDAPFGTDTQRISPPKARRVPTSDLGGKENEALTLQGIGHNEQNRVMNAGKRIMKTESKPSPFGTVDHKFDSVTTSQRSQLHASAIQNALDQLKGDEPVPKQAAGRSDNRNSDMGDVMSQRAYDLPGDHQQQGVRIVKKTSSDIFNTRPSSPVQAPRTAARSTAPWASESDGAVSQYTGTAPPMSNVFNQTAEVARSGRARIQPKVSSNNIF